jgi:hypothetical protein
MNNPLFYDIETGPSPESEIAHFMPEFEAPSNYKDEAKIAAFIEEKRQKWLEEAPLYANRGQVLAIGIRQDGEFFFISDSEGEAHLLSTFWNLIAPDGYVQNPIIGFNSNRFDLPFLIRRSWKLGVKVPVALMQGRYLNSLCIDLMERWQCGDRQASISLDSLAKFFGFAGKNGEGKYFHQLWKSDPVAAVAYLENDLLLTEQCARAMGVV